MTTLSRRRKWAERPVQISFKQVDGKLWDFNGLLFRCHVKGFGTSFIGIGSTLKEAVQFARKEAYRVRNLRKKKGMLQLKFHDKELENPALAIKGDVGLTMEDYGFSIMKWHGDSWVNCVTFQHDVYKGWQQVGGDNRGPVTSADIFKTLQDYSGKLPEECHIALKGFMVAWERFHFRTTTTAEMIPYWKLLRQFFIFGFGPGKGRQAHAS